MSVAKLVLSFAAVLGVVGAIDPRFAENITVYHVNPQQYGAKPINMDTGDAPGDMFFDFHNVIILPLECPNGAKSGHGCTNPEAVSPDLVVNKVILEVDRRYSGYAKCELAPRTTRPATALQASCC